MLDNENIELPDEEEILEIDQSIESNEPVQQETVLSNNDDDGKQEDDYGKKVSKRINKLVAERNRERDERKREQEENQDLRRKIQEIEFKNHKTTQAGIDAQISALRKQKVLLLEEGDFEEAAVVDEQMIDAKLQKRKAPEMPATTPNDTPKTEEVEIPQAQADWLEGNEWLNDDPENFKKADKEYLQLVNNEGYDPQDVDTYAELDSRLKKSRKPVNRPPPPTAAPDRGSAITGANSSNSITSSDIARMREFNLDPNNPEQRKAWLANKRG